MNRADMLALLPILLIAGTAVVVMLGIAFRRNHAMTAALTLVGLAAAFVSLLAAVPLASRQVTLLLVVDRYALFYMGLIIASAAVVTVFSHRYLGNHESRPEELYLLLLLATLGCAVLVASDHFVSFFLGLEILSISLYAMVAYVKDRKRPLEAGIKYLILAAASSAFLLFGMALIYGETGTMELSRLRELTPNTFGLRLLLPGIVLIITGIGFKLGVVPFHLWTPDVYEGAPAPITAFVASASKTAMFALLLRFFYVSGVLRYRAVFLVFAIIAIASMAAGNLLAIEQTNVKRILAYSSIAHFGYILVAFLARPTRGPEAVTFYLVAYTVTILTSFGVVTVLSSSERDADDLEDYRGLVWRRPIIASVFTVALFSLAGIPATIGFVAKFSVLAAGASVTAWALIFILVITSTAGLYYYLRVVVALYAATPEQSVASPPIPRGSSSILAVLTILLIFFGVYPGPLLNLIRTTMPGLR